MITTFSLSFPGFAATPAFEIGNIGPNSALSFTGSRGWGFFNGPNSPIVITELGVFDSGADGLINSHEVGLWTTDGTLLASGIVPSGTAAPLIDGYRYISIMPVILPGSFGGGSGYIMTAQYGASDSDDIFIPFPIGLAPGLAGWYGGYPSVGWYGFGSDLPFPNQRTPPLMEGSIGPGFWEPNFRFEVVPEPSLWLITSVMGSMLFTAFRRAWKGPTSDTRKPSA
ncbi:MAG: hypothetical protein QOF48_2453 [Verrucomicrobiota bacterium]